MHLETCIYIPVVFVLVVVVLSLKVATPVIDLTHISLFSNEILAPTNRKCYLLAYTNFIKSFSDFADSFHLQIYLLLLFQNGPC